MGVPEKKIERNSQNILFFYYGRNRDGVANVVHMARARLTEVFHRIAAPEAEAEVRAVMEVLLVVMVDIEMVEVSLDLAANAKRLFQVETEASHRIAAPEAGVVVLAVMKVLLVEMVEIVEVPLDFAANAAKPFQAEAEVIL